MDRGQGVGEQGGGQGCCAYGPFNVGPAWCLISRAAQNRSVGSGYVRGST